MKYSNYIREPIALFRQIKENKKPNKLLDNLKSAYPKELKVGAAIMTGDCFFDSVAQRLNELNIKPGNHFSAKSLRKDCADYAEQHGEQEDSWTCKAVIKDAAIGGYFTALEGPHGPIQDPRTKINIIDEEKTFRKYLKNIKNMATGSGSSPIWGRLDIEGRMICEKYKVKIEVIALEEELIDGRYTNTGEEGEGDNVVHIVNYRGHFVPLLSKIPSDIIESQPVSREEILGTNVAIPSNQLEQPVQHNTKASRDTDRKTPFPHQQEGMQKKLTNSYRKETIYGIATAITAIVFTASAIAAVFTQPIPLACLAGVALVVACVCAYQLTQSHKDVNELKSELEENITHAFLEGVGLKIHSLIDKAISKV